MDSDQYPEEEQYLAETVEFIDKEITRLKDRPMDYGPDRDSHIAIKKKNDDQLRRYLDLRPRPYFGRLDFVPSDGDQPLEAYIGTGYVSLSDKYFVYDWRAPFPGQLYYSDPKKEASYRAPAGEIRGRITLKRQYAIENACLVEVTEVYRSRPAVDGREAAEDFSADVMTRQLSRTRTGELREAVATLQWEQYQQIAAAPEQLMLVQGVAGSGKSIVGLHRVAYLLSPLNVEQGRINPSRVVVFGPTRTFLTYVANLLPSIDVHNVNQRTVRDWLRSTLSEKVYLDRGEPLLEKLLRSKGKQWQDAYHTAKLKGSLQMSRALERHVKTLQRQFLSRATGLAVKFSSPTPMVLDNARTHRIVRSVPSGPLNHQRKLVIDRCIGELWETYSRQAAGALTRQRSRSEFVERVRPQVEQQVATFWPELDFRLEYRRLLSTPSFLSQASSKSMGERERSLLTASLPQRPTVFQPEDLGALCYLDHLLNEHPNSMFEHVVLDEAQEVSPVELLVIRRHSRGIGFTILGDLAQRLSPQGIDRWGEVLQLFRGATASRHVARTSYRATYEITRYANRILKKAVPSAATAVPFRRAGPPPSLRQSRSYNEMVAAISADIGELETLGAKTIAVACKTAVDAKKMHRALRDNGVTDVGLMDQERAPSDNVLVAPIYLIRGLEYDAVILAGANKEHYPDTPLHNKLLYIAVSRAAHHLRVHWFGQPAPQLGVPPPSPLKKKRVSKGQRRQQANTSTLPGL